MKAQLASWRDGAEAKALLARLGRQPPRREMRLIRDVTSFFAEVYVGKEVRRLHRLYNDFGQKIVDTPAFEPWCFDSVEKAINDAIAEAALRRRAA
jgi:hypothetical protein